MTEEIYIFDIDGCIMPPIISNFDDNNNSREETVKESVSNGQKMELFPEFIKFYQNHCERAKLVIFITGRKKSEFGDLTEFHLKPFDGLKRYKIIYYPEGKPHNSDEYFEWKIKEIQKILNINEKNQFNEYNNSVSFKIFDDMDDYFPKIKDLSKKFGINIQLYLIKGENSWNFLNN